MNARRVIVVDRRPPWLPERRIAMTDHLDPTNSSVDVKCGRAETQLRLRADCVPGDFPEPVLVGVLVR